MKSRFFTLLAVLFISRTAVAQNWQLVWADDFTNGISADWVFETGNGSGGWGNNELQYYRPENASVQNGELVITAKRESFGGYNYTSARMKTQGRKSWRFGKIEARIKMPAFSGIWPAFWLLGDNINTVSWPGCGEIDVMEHINAENKVYGTPHWSDNNGNYASYGGNIATNVTDYHVYNIEWNTNAIKWFVDGVQYHEINIANGINGTGEFQNNFFILLNMAVGGNWPGFNIDNNGFPAKMYVDYVHVYQGGGTNPPSTVFIEAENYSSMAGVQTEATTDAGGGTNVGWIDAGDWMAYNNITFPASGTYKVEYRVASLNGGGQLSLDLNAGSTVLGSLAVPSTGGWQNWATISHNVTVNAGTYALGVYAPAGGWNLNWIRITALNGSRIALTPVINTTAPAKGLLTASDFTLYPNPAVQEINIRSKADLTGGISRIFDAQGREVLTVKNGARKINVASLAKGIYTWQFTRDGTYGG